MSRTPAKVTQADIARAIRAAMQAGASAVEITPSGTIRIHLGAAPSGTFDKHDALPAWSDYAQSALPQERIRTRHPRAKGGLVGKYDVVAYEKYLRKELNMFELPPGQHPDGTRIYADGEWEAIIRSKPMGQREMLALGNYYREKGKLGYVKGTGLDTTERLAARGFVEVVQERDKDRVPFYGITPAGEAEWLRINADSQPPS